MTKWIWGIVEEKKMKPALSAKLSTMDKETGAAEFVGSSGEIYHTTLTSCSCVSFSVNKKQSPCKHMIRLAVECALIDKSGLTPNAAAEKALHDKMDTLALANGYYHLFGKRLISDASYDTLKAELDAHGMLDRK